MKALKAVSAVLLASAAGFAVAHPGHGVHLGDASALHPFLGVEHVALAALVGVAGYALRGWLAALGSKDKE